MKKYIFPLISALLVAYLHKLGMNNALYFHYWWYDVMMHFLGGATIALFFSIFTKNWKYILAGMLIVAIGWEVFEYVFNIAVIPGQNYAIDTVKDFIMDTLGALIIIWLI